MTSFRGLPALNPSSKRKKNKYDVIAVSRLHALIRSNEISKQAHQFVEPIVLLLLLEESFFHEGRM